MRHAGLEQPIKAAPPDRQSLGLAMPAASQKQLRWLMARGNLARLLHGLVLLLALAALAHILTTLLIPHYASQDSGSLFVVSGAEGRADLIGTDVNPETAIIDADPFTAIGAMVTRRSQGGTDLDASQAVTPEEAVAAYTRLGAWAQREEHEKGMLREGMLADLAVLDRDIIEGDPAAIAGTCVLATVVGGRVAYAAG